MLFDALEAATMAAAEPRDPREMGVTFLFDWDNHRYYMESGSPVEVTGTEAVQAWMQQVLRTKQRRYAIYPSDFGALLQDLIGYKAPNGFLLSELRRQLLDSAGYCAAIQEIGKLEWNRDGTITGDLTLEDPSGESTEVITYVP